MRRVRFIERSKKWRKEQEKASELGRKNWAVWWDLHVLSVTLSPGLQALLMLPSALFFLPVSGGQQSSKRHRVNFLSSSNPARMWVLGLWFWTKNSKADLAMDSVCLRDSGDSVAALRTKICSQVCLNSQSGRDQTSWSWVGPLRPLLIHTPGSELMSHVQRNAPH